MEIVSHWNSRERIRPETNYFPESWQIFTIQPKFPSLPLHTAVQTSSQAIDKPQKMMH
jgi:hypothetical protein